MKPVFLQSLAVLGSSLLLGLACAAETAGKQGPLVSEPVGFGSYLQMFLGLAFIVALIIGMGWFIRRMGHFQTVASGNLKLLGGLSLGQRERIVLVQVGEQQLLVGVAPGQIRTLHVLAEPISMTDTHTSMPSGFAEKLQMLLKQKMK